MKVSLAVLQAHTIGGRPDRSGGFSRGADAQPFGDGDRNLSAKQLGRTLARVALVLALCVLLVCGRGGSANASKAVAEYRQYSPQIKVLLDKLYQQHPDFSRPGSTVTELHVFDFDHTIADTRTEIPVRSADGKVRQEDSKCFQIHKGDRADFEVFTRPRLLASAPIAPTIARLQALTKRSESAVFIVTARSQEHTYESAKTYLITRGIRVNAVLPVNSELFEQGLWRKMKKSPKGMKKPFLIAGLADQIQATGARLKLIRYHEDTDKYIAAFLNLMPALYPGIAAEVFDYTRKLDSKNPNNILYAELLAGRVEGGQAFRANREQYPLPVRYDSGDCPLR